MKKTPIFLYERERGSGLLVTIMIVSVVLLMAMVLLERIIPYSRQIRSLSDSLQAYYTARGQLELGIQEFQNQGSRKDIDRGRLLRYENSIVTIKPREGKNKLDEAKTGDFLVLSTSKTLPLVFKFLNDDQQYLFGTYRGNKEYHNLGIIGGVTLELSGINVGKNTEIKLKTSESSLGSISGTIGIESNKYDNNPTNTNDTFVSKKIGTVNNMNLSDIELTIAPGDTRKLSDFFASSTCASDNIECFLKIAGSNFTPTSDFGVQIISDEAIPDMNAIIIAEGISTNTQYHTRLIDLIPTIQAF